MADTATSLDPYIQAHWEVGKWTTDLGLRHSTMDMQVDDHYQANGDSMVADARYAQDFAQGVQTIDSGNRLPGVPLNNLYGELVWKPTASVSMGLEGQYRSKVYVEDSNTAKPAPAYVVFNWSTRFEQRFGSWMLHQLVRLENIMDRQYVGSVIVGDSNSRYYEAAPGRSWYAGAGLEYRFQ